MRKLLLAGASVLALGAANADAASLHWIVPAVQTTVQCNGTVNHVPIGPVPLGATVTGGQAFIYGTAVVNGNPVIQQALTYMTDGGVDVLISAGSSMTPAQSFGGSGDSDYTVTASGATLEGAYSCSGGGSILVLPQAWAYY